jgi:hypothetical protein
MESRFKKKNLKVKKKRMNKSETQINYAIILKLAELCYNDNGI